MQLIHTKPKILLIEDNQGLSENISELLNINGYEVIGIFDSAEDVEAFDLDIMPDVILIDIKLRGKKSGIEIADDFRKELKIPIIFITSASGKEVIEKVKHLKPDGFIVKPFTKESLITTIELAISNFETASDPELTSQLVPTKTSPEEIFIRENGWLKKILVSKILYIKAEGTYTQLILEGKHFTLRNTAKEIMARLDENNFIRVHKSFIVNLKEIEAFNSSVVKIGESEIPIGRNYYKDLINVVYKINN